MVKPIDQLNMGPTRSAKLDADGNWDVTVKPPLFMELPAVTLKMRPDQYDRYNRWLDGKGVIQEMLPEFNNAEREMLMTGIGDQDFKKIFSEPCPDCEGTGGLFATHGHQVIINEPCKNCGGTGKI